MTTYDIFQVVFIIWDPAYLAKRSYQVGVFQDLYCNSAGKARKAKGPNSSINPWLASQCSVLYFAGQDQHLGSDECYIPQVWELFHQAMA